MRITLNGSGALGNVVFIADQPECGDGVTEGNEQCDDGNDVDNDGCPLGADESVNFVRTPRTLFRPTSPTGTTEGGPVDFGQN